MMKYIGKHWRGELILVVSFWINLIFIKFCIRLFETWLTETTLIENPVFASQVWIGYLFIVFIFIYPWQIIGLWRSANRHIEETQKKFWPGVVKVLIVLGLFQTVGIVNTSLPVYKELYQLGIGKDQYGDYRVELIENGSLIHLKGGLGFGISKEVKQLVAKNPNVKGIILDSAGGRIYEGRELSKIILINGLDTYSIKGCYSACGTAFISGNKRYLGDGANLAFHQYHSTSKNLKLTDEMASEQKKDLLIYQRRDISQDFIDRIFSAEKDDLWYPTIDEMMTARVIHGIVNPSNLKPIKYESFTTSEIDKSLMSISTFITIKKYDPEEYKQIVKNFALLMEKGASRIEFQQATNNYTQVLANKLLPTTSDKALIAFIRAFINALVKLEKNDPILGMKYLYPDKYGSLEYTKYFNTEEMKPMLNALSLVIKDSYEIKNPQLNTSAAEELFEKIATQLGDDIKYIEIQELKNKDDYSKACNTIVKFYNLILLEDFKIAANGLRYAFSE